MLLLQSAVHFNYFIIHFPCRFWLTLRNKRKSVKVFMSRKMGVNISLYLSHSFVCGQSFLLRYDILNIFVSLASVRPAI